ncbi:MAG: hypothetical protein JW395_0843 [Nitrospira sp.]|nr:hypothetical protein [Nitrospira sp.]
MPLAATTGITQTWRKIIEPRDLHLKPGRSGASMSTENLNDDAGTVEHRHAGGTFKIFQLGRRQITVHDDDLRLFARTWWGLAGVIRFVVF